MNHAHTLTRPQTLSECQQMFSSIFGERNKKLYTDKDCLLQVVENNARIAECLRKEEENGIQEIVELLPKTFAWLIALWNTKGLVIEDALWHKYPGVCPYCLRRQDCSCISKDLAYDPERNLNVFRRDHTLRPRTLAAWQERHGEIYGKMNKVKSRLQVWLHFVEEVGEVSVELRHERKEEFANESADALMWLFAFANRISASLDEATWRVYPYECDTCHKEQCECPYV